MSNHEPDHAPNIGTDEDDVLPELRGYGAVLSVAEVADLLKVDRKTVHRMTGAGVLPFIPLRREKRFRRAVIQDLLLGKLNTAAPPSETTDEGETP